MLKHEIALNVFMGGHIPKTLHIETDDFNINDLALALKSGDKNVAVVPYNQVLYIREKRQSTGKLG